MGLSRPLPEVVTDILTLEGAILEKKNDACMEFLLPSSLAGILGIPEHGTLSFSPLPSFEETISASYESELFRALERLFSGKGKMAMAAYPSFLPPTEKISKWVSEKIALSNATFRLQKVEHQTVAYALILFKYVALSDEKREGAFLLLVNERNLSTLLLNDHSVEFLADLKNPKEAFTKSPEETRKAVQAGFASASAIVKEEFVPFIKSLERRLNRDIKRVVEYYETLKAETQKAFEKKTLLAGDSADEMPEVNQILSGKMDAIEGEKKGKIQDLISKYALDVRIEPVSVIDIEAESLVFWLDIRRRLSSRLFPLIYNPLVRKIDPLPCEGCFYPRGGYYICDEKLHILCASCFKKCPSCARQYCSACHPKGCPRCKN